MQIAPPAKGSLGRPWWAVEYASLDFEATGLDFAKDRIISFGVVPILNGRVEVGESVYQLVDPGGVPPSPESVTVHGLRPIDLKDAPPASAARESLSAALAGRYLVTWWAGVEAAFLDKLFGGGVRSWFRRAVDVRQLVIALEGEGATRLTLTQAAEKYGVPVASPHHALDDALVTAQLFLVTASKMTSMQKGKVKDLLRPSLASDPVLTRPRGPM
jgi:DNA polymerase III subunit epsilon